MDSSNPIRGLGIRTISKFGDWGLAESQFLYRVYTFLYRVYTFGDWGLAESPFCIESRKNCIESILLGLCRIPKMGIATESPKWGLQKPR